MLQPSIQTADRYRADTPAHSVLFVDMSYRPWFSALRSSVPCFHALFNFLICSAFLGKPSGCNIVNISYFFPYVASVFVFNLKIIMDLEISEQYMKVCQIKHTSDQALNYDSLHKT